MVEYEARRPKKHPGTGVLISQHNYNQTSSNTHKEKQQHAPHACVFRVFGSTSRGTVKYCGHSSRRMQKLRGR